MYFRVFCYCLYIHNGLFELSILHSESGNSYCLQYFSFLQRQGKSWSMNILDLHLLPSLKVQPAAKLSVYSKIRFSAQLRSQCFSEVMNVFLSKQGEQRLQALLVVHKLIAKILYQDPIHLSKVRHDSREGKLPNRTSKAQAATISVPSSRLYENKLFFKTILQLTLPKRNFFTMRKMR